MQPKLALVLTGVVLKFYVNNLGPDGTQKRSGGYYGKVLQSSPDIQTNACFEPAEMLTWLKKVLSSVHHEVLMCYCVCGLIALEALKGARVLDLGCVAGRDVYACRKWWASNGFSWRSI